MSWDGSHQPTRKYCVNRLSFITGNDTEKTLKKCAWRKGIWLPWSADIGLPWWALRARVLGFAVSAHWSSTPKGLNLLNFGNCFNHTVHERFRCKCAFPTDNLPGAITARCLVCLFLGAQSFSPRPGYSCGPGAAGGKPAFTALTQDVVRKSCQLPSLALLSRSCLAQKFPVPQVDPFLGVQKKYPCPCLLTCVPKI